MLYSLIFLFSIACVLKTGRTQESGEDLPRTFRFHENERPCTYRRQQGFCQRRSECKRPTAHICRFGFNPVVCCMDEIEPKTTTTTTTTTKRPDTTKRPATTRRGSVKPDANKEIDLTFPGCGFRSPRVHTTPKPSSNTRVSRNRGGILSRLGKRAAHSWVDFAERRAARPRRNVQKVIVGGATAKANSWPWMVAIFKETSPRTPKKFLCGASLISQKYVLTAAHCFDAEKGVIDPNKFTVLAGSHTTKDGTEHRVENILVHSAYKTRQYYNDISLLRLSNPVTLSQKAYPVCLPSDRLRDKIIAGNNNVTVTGWGDTSFGGVSSKELQELTIPIVPLKDCNESYSKLPLVNFPKGITNLFMCAGVKEGGKDACQGDSGGPLVTKLKDMSYVQLGVVSFGYGCAQAGFPGVYTRTSQFTEWLYEHTDLGK